MVWYDGVASQIAVFVRRQPKNMLQTQVKKNTTSVFREEGVGAEERLNRTDSTVSTRLVWTRRTAYVKCRCGKICKYLRGLRIHQGRMACGSTYFISVETLEDPSEDP